MSPEERWRPYFQRSLAFLFALACALAVAGYARHFDIRLRHAREADCARLRVVSSNQLFVLSRLRELEHDQAVLHAIQRRILGLAATTGHYCNNSKP